MQKKPRLESAACAARGAAALGAMCVLATAATRAQIPLYTPDESRWFTNVRQLTSEALGLDRAGEAYFSHDARRIAFQAYPTGRSEYQIYVMNVDGSGLAMVSTGHGATTCAHFHPGGRKLLFAANHLDPRPAAANEPGKGSRGYAWSFFPGMDLFEFTFETGALRRLTDSEGYDAEGSYSPDGRRIVFSSMRDGDQEIYICDEDGGNARRITRARGYDGGPFFSPDGRRIVYRSDRAGNQNLQIFTNNLEGTDERPLTDASVLHWCPYWHPSGKWIIYTRADHGTPDAPRRPFYDLYLIHVSPDHWSAPTPRIVPDPEHERVTFDEAFDGLPSFSPDGSKLLWTSRRGGLAAPQVFIADFTGLTRAGDLR